MNKEHPTDEGKKKNLKFGHSLLDIGYSERI
jgi:hypothetical protein